HEALEARSAALEKRTKELRAEAERLQESARSLTEKAAHACATVEKSLCEALVHDEPEPEAPKTEKSAANATRPATRRLSKGQEETLEDLSAAKGAGESSASISVPFKIAVSTVDGPVATHIFEKDAIVIGRDPKSDVHLDNMLVSRRHAEVRRN